MPPCLARSYMAYLIFITMAYQAIVVVILMDKPLIDARNGGWKETAFIVIMKLYLLVSMFILIDCSVWTIINSDNTNMFRMAIQ